MVGTDGLPTYSLLRADPYPLLSLHTSSQRYLSASLLCMNDESLWALTVTL
jgi:hypothetical protein